MSTLFTRSLLRGYSDAFTDAGAAPPWAHDALADAAFDKIASDLNLPEVLEASLPVALSLKCGQHVLAHQKHAHEQGHTASATTIVRTKSASTMSLEDRGARAATFYMTKAAEEASLNGTGENTPESATANSSLARLDQKNRPTLKYMVGRGETDLPEAGVIGKQHAVHPSNTVPINNTLTHLDKQAATKLAAEDIARGLLAIDGASARGFAPTEAKVVLAAACLAETRDNRVIETFRSKQADEMDGDMDHALETYDHHGETPDPELVAALEHILQSGEVPPEVAEALHHIHGGGAGLPAEEEGAGAEEVDPAAEAEEAKEHEAEGEPKAAADESTLVARNPHTSLKAPSGLGGPAKSTIGEKIRSIIKNNKGAIQVGAGSLAAGALTHAVQSRLTRTPLQRAGAAIKSHPKHVAAAGLAALGLAALGAHASQDKEGALLESLKAAADGSLNDTGTNTPEDAAKHNANAELDQKNRKTEAYKVERGETKLPVKEQARHEVEKMSSYAATVKSAAETWGAKLPATMSISEKRAHIVALAGMPESFRAQYIRDLAAE